MPRRAAMHRYAPSLAGESHGRRTGYAYPSLFLETPEQQFRNEMEVNYLGSVWPAQVRAGQRPDG